MEATSLEDQHHEQLLQLEAKFNWRKFQYNYSIVSATQQESPLLVLLGVYSSNYYIASMSGAIGGLV